MKLEKCKECDGTGRVECCNGHMCPGTKECYDCEGKGKVLSKKDRKRKEELMKLLEYK